MNFDPTQYGNRIKQTRIKNHMTQEQLAEQLHIYRKHLSKIENGHSTGSIELLVEIAEVLRVSIDYLLLGELSPHRKVKSQIDDAIEILLVARKHL